MTVAAATVISFGALAAIVTVVLIARNAVRKCQDLADDIEYCREQVYGVWHEITDQRAEGPSPATRPSALIDNESSRYPHSGQVFPRSGRHRLHPDRDTSK
ncbi:hypothetical protein GCM10023192_88310 [Amycolatopsis samaneae]